MQVTANASWKWTTDLPEKVMDKDEIEKRILIAPAPIYALRYIDDFRYLPGATTLETERLKQPRDNNVKFLHGRSPWFPKELRSFRIHSVQALRSVDFDE